MKSARPVGPRLLAEVVVAPLSDGEVIVATADSQRALVLNETAAIIVSLCTGEHSVADLAQLLAETLGLDLDRAEQDVLALLAELRSQGLLEHGD